MGIYTFFCADVKEKKQRDWASRRDAHMKSEVKKNFSITVKSQGRREKRDTDTHR